MRHDRLGRGIRLLFRLPEHTPDSIVSETNEEIRLHLALRAEELVRSGYTVEAARAEAERRFGAMEEVRPGLHASALRRDWRMRLRERIDELQQDIRYGWRGVERAPVFAALVIATLAIGIGAATAVFSVINGVLLRPLPYADADRIVAVHTRWGNGPLERANVSYPELLDVASLPVFQRVAAHSIGNATITGDGGSGGDPERVPTLHGMVGIFEVLRTGPSIGRVFTTDEDRPGADRVVVLAHRYWQRRFAGDREVIGRPMTIDGTARTIIGVMPPHFRFGDADLYMPLAIDPSAGGSARGAHNFRAIGRLATGVTHAQVNVQVDALTARLRRDHPENYPPKSEFGLFAIGLHEALVGNVGESLGVLAGVVALVLLIACANAANLMLARAEGRQRELAVRAALGAGRGRIARQLLAESAMLAIAAGGLGLLLAVWGVRGLLGINPDALPRHESVQLDLTVVGVALLLSLFTGIVFGILPALQASRTDLHVLLKSGGRTGTLRGRGMLRRSLVIGEIALSMIVVVAAGLLLRSFGALRGVDAGLDPAGVLTMSTSLPASRYAAERVEPAYEEILGRLRILPGVREVGAMGLLPLAVSGWSWEIVVEGRLVSPGEPAPSPRPQVVTPGALDAMGISLAGGRGITSADDADAPLVALVNETMARALWPETSPLGQRFRMSGSREAWATVVGIVQDVRSGTLREPAEPEFYIPHAQFRRFANWTMRNMTLVIRADGDPALLAAPARRAIATVDPMLAAADVRTMAQVLDRSVAQPRFTMVLLSAFGAVALLLASVGIYGLIAHGVAQRTREFGIRFALGARRSDVLRLVLREGVALAVLGVGLGVAGALAATRVLDSLLFGVSATDPLSFAAIALLLLLVATLATVIPALRATRAHPAVALHAE